MKLEQMLAQVLRRLLASLPHETSAKAKMLCAWGALLHIELITAIEAAFGAKFATSELTNVGPLGCMRLYERATPAEGRRGLSRGRGRAGAGSTRTGPAT